MITGVVTGVAGNFVHDSLKRHFSEESGLVSGVGSEYETVELRIKVNGNLVTYPAIKQRLDNAALAFETLGYAKPPSRLLVSFGRGVSVESLQQILRLVSDLGVDSIQFLSGAAINGEVMIGSYGYEEANVYHSGYFFEQEPIATLDPDFLSALLRPSITSDELVDLVTSRARHEEKLSKGGGDEKSADVYYVANIVYHRSSLPPDKSPEIVNYTQLEPNKLPLAGDLEPNVQQTLTAKNTPIVLVFQVESDPPSFPCYQLEAIKVKGHYPTRAEQDQATPHVVTVNRYLQINVSHDSRYVVQADDCNFP